MEVRGKTLVPVGFERSYSPSTGYSTTYQFEGTKDAIESLSARLSGVEHRVDHTNPPVSKLSYTVNGAGDNTDVNAVLEVQFELLANTSQKDLFEHPKSRALSDQEIDLIRETLKRTESNATKPNFAGASRSLYTLANRGQDSYVDSQFVFRITQIIGRRATALPIAFRDINRVYTSEAVINETGPSDIYVAAIHAAEAATRASIGGAVHDGYTLGWLKQAPTLTNIADGKIAVSVEYWCGEIADYPYTD